MLTAFVAGWRRAIGAPTLVLSVTLALLAVSVPLAMRPGDLVGGDVASTLRSALLLAGGAWTGDQIASSSAPAPAAMYALLGVGATLAGPFLVFWVFLSGGILDRLARGRAVGTAQFFAACGVYLFRFARLGLIVAGAYILLFRLFRPQISNRAEILTFLALLAVVNLVADFTKVRAVVEDRRSILGALMAAIRFIRHHPVATVSLYSLNVLTAIAAVLIWQRSLPQSLVLAGPWTVFLVSATYLLLRVVLRLAFMGSEIVYFQQTLAHAGYTAAPAMVWPDSPAVEAIQNLVPRAESKSDGRGGNHGPEASAW